MGMRIMSRESADMVYHRPECRYAKRIYKRNRIQMNWEDAEWKGYRPCKCCDGADFLYKLEEPEIQRYAKQFHMDVDLDNHKIYVRTCVGCWKIIYKICNQSFILLHRNYVNGKIKLEEAENAPYHRQGDMAESKSIMKMIKYIKNHDEFKQRTGGDYRRMPQDSRKQKLYYRAAKKRMERRGARRLNQLFALIESGASER